MGRFASRTALAGTTLLLQLGAAPEIRAGISPPPFATAPVNNPAADAGAQNTQTDTAVVLGATGTVLVAFTDSGSYESGSAFRFSGWSRSTNYGGTFTDLGAFSSNGNNNDAGSPRLARDSVTGRVYASAAGFTSNAVRVLRSDNDGTSWLAAVDVMGGPCDSTCDVPVIAVDNAAGATQGNVYVATRDFGAGPGIYLSRSTDHGATWSGGVLVESAGAGNVQGPMVAVGADHLLYVAYFDSDPSSVRLKRSTDFGLTFSAAQQIAPILSTGTNGDLGLGFRTNAFPKLVANPAEANELFAAFADNPAGVDRGNVYLTRSTDYGQTWSLPMQVNDDDSPNDQFTPALAISPDGTRLFVGWYDRREDVSNVLVRYYGRLARLGGAPVFAPAFPVSEGFWTPCNGIDPVANSGILADWDLPAAGPSNFFASFVDCTFGDPDVRLSRIPKDYVFRDGFVTGGPELWSSHSP